MGEDQRIDTLSADYHPGRTLPWTELFRFSTPSNLARFTRSPSVSADWIDMFLLDTSRLPGSSLVVLDPGEGSVWTRADGYQQATTVHQRRTNDLGSMTTLQVGLLTVPKKTASRFRHSFGTNVDGDFCSVAWRLCFYRFHGYYLN